MCGRFVAAYDADRLADDWDARVSSSLPPVTGASCGRLDCSPYGPRMVRDACHAPS